jgi:predicted ATP-grasp superfamily ATP-dependent carboligase
VVGACAHGLAIARSLWRAGLAVVVLESDASLPGVRTRAARVLRVSGIHGQQLLDALEVTAASLGAGRPLPLFLTNDRMIAAVAGQAAAVGAAYRVSWLHAAPAIVPLLSKTSLAERCRATGLDYPRTVTVAEAITSAADELDALRFPVILKPDRPLSAFKTRIVRSRDDLAAALHGVQDSLPVVVQEYIPGDDTHIRFGALYLRRGEVLARFEGRKLRSRPLGHTTVAVSAPDHCVHALARRFFDGLGISGPVSLELKRDADGRHWVIEPTVGRTDFWVDLCAGNGVDLPLIEYAAVNGATLPRTAQCDRRIWVNGERDPGAIAWLLCRHPRELFGRWPQGVYLSLADPRPYFAASSSRLARLPGRIWRRISGQGRGAHRVS